jgi:YCII-related domain
MISRTLQSTRASWPPTGRSPTARIPETKEVTGGLTVVDVPSLDEALQWAAKIAVTCRCAQDVREFLPDPNSPRCFASWIADGDVPTTSDRRSPARA